MSTHSSTLPPFETAEATLAGGVVTVVADPVSGEVVASGWKPLGETFAFLTPAEQQRGHVPAGPDGGAAKTALDALHRYADGDLDALDAVAVRQAGGPFLQRAWTELRGVRAGETASYAELAALAGSPAAVRAAGQACARNKVAPFVPCHRILRTDGSLGGYAYGLPVKEALLVHEGALSSAAPSAAPLF